MPKKLTEVTLSPAISSKLVEWSNLAKQLAEVKAKEFDLRQQIVREAGFDPTKLEGSQTLSIGNGWRLNALKDQNYSAKLDHIMPVLNYLGNSLQRGDLAQNLIEWKPVIKETVYKKEVLPLTKDDKQLAALLATAIEIKPGAPQLKLIPPDEKEEETA